MPDVASPEASPRGLTDEAIESAVSALDAEDAPEAAPVEQEPAGQPPQAPPPTPDAKPRDAQGRFAKAEPPAAPQAPEPAAAPETPPEPTPAASPEGEPPAEEFPSASYRVDGQPVTIAGSQVGEDGVFIPTASWPQVQQLLSAGHGLPRRLSDANRAREQARAESQAFQTARQKIVQRLDELAERGLLVEWAQNAQEQWPALRTEALHLEQEQLRQHLEQRNAALEQEIEERDLRPRLESHLEDLVLGFAQQPAYTGVDPQWVYQTFQGNLDRVFLRAEEDDPQGRWRAGEIVVNEGLIESEYRRLAQVITGSRKAAADAVKQSERAVSTSGAPPTVTAIGPTPSGTPKAPKAKSRAEAEALLNQSLASVEELIAE